MNSQLPALQSLPWCFARLSIKNLTTSINDQLCVVFYVVLLLQEKPGAAPLARSARDLHALIGILCRYHRLPTQRLMKAYRIARVHLPWANFTPPICNGIFRRMSCTEARPELHKYAGKDIEKTAAIDVDTEAGPTKEEQEDQRRSLSKPDTCSLLRKRPSREEYILGLEEEEIDSDILAYPSLDQKTQDAISKEYGALHEQIKNEGFYTCRYSEYAKDSIRWGILFAGFVFFLTSKWYITSAIFLGMFWVCLELAELTAMANI
jgi:hypothetical protein